MNNLRREILEADPNLDEEEVDEIMECVLRESYITAVNDDAFEV